MNVQDSFKYLEILINRNAHTLFKMQGVVYNCG